MPYYFEVHFVGDGPEGDGHLTDVGTFDTEEEAKAAMDAMRDRAEFASKLGEFVTHQIYAPLSDFVRLAASGDIPFDGGELADKNLDQLIAFTRDPDKSNRDWATMALGMYGPETSKVLDALVLAAVDEDRDVRGEAIEAIARRDRQTALPILQRELSGNDCGVGAFVAAGLVADSSLVEPLEAWLGEEESSRIDDDIREALEACRSGTAIGHY